MAVLLDDRDAVRPMLYRDPIRNAVVIHRMFHHPDFTLAFADALPEPKAVLALKPSTSNEAPHQLALHAIEPMAAVHVLHAVPQGFCLFHVADELAFPAMKQRIAPDWWGEAVYFTMRREDFVDIQAHEVRPVPPGAAARIARLWAPEWTATEYVRSRIEEGPSAGIYDDEDLVAWYLTHLETDEVTVLGFLHVLEPYRGRGYAKSLSCALARAVFARGKVPVCHVYTDNRPSIRLMETLGFRRTAVQLWGSGIAKA